MASTRTGYLAVKRESTAAVAVKPTNFVRYKDGDIMLKQDLIANNPIQNNRRNALNAVKGKMTSEGTYNFDLDFNECVHFVSAALGGISTADVGTPAALAYQHTITVTNTLPTLSIEQAKGDLTDTTNNRQNYQVDRAFGAMIDSFTISGSDGILNLEVAIKAHGVLQKRSLITNAAAGSSVALALDSAEGFVATVDTVNIYDGLPQSEQKAIASLSLTANTITIATLSNSYQVARNAKVELVPQSPTYAVAAKVASFVHARFQFGADLTAAASAAFENVEDREFSYSNELEERFGSLRSSPSVIAPKGAKASFKFTKYFTNVSDRDRYLDQTKRAGIITISNGENVAPTETTNKKFTIKIEISDCRFTSYEMPTGTDELYACSIEAECFYDTTDGRALRFLVTNGSAGSVYA